jgi:hypothetical protein
MIDLASETTISLAQVAREQPPGRGGAPCSLGCVLRWVLKGVRSPAGELVRLEAIRLGGRWITSREAVQRWAEKLTPRLDGEAAPAPRTATARRRAADKASKELEAMGV